MHVHETPADRHRGDLLIQQAYVLTLLGFWIVIVLVVWCIVPLGAPGVWPLLDSIETRGGRKAPAMELDVFVSVTAAGDVYVGERVASPGELLRAMARAAEPRIDRRGDTYWINVFVRVDKRAPFGAVREVVRAAQEAKRTQLTFLADPAFDSTYRIMW